MLFGHEQHLPIESPLHILDISLRLEKPFPSHCQNLNIVRRDKKLYKKYFTKICGNNEIINRGNAHHNLRMMDIVRATPSWMRKLFKFSEK